MEKNKTKQKALKSLKFLWTETENGVTRFKIFKVISEAVLFEHNIVIW